MLLRLFMEATNGTVITKDVLQSVTSSYSSDIEV